MGSNRLALMAPESSGQQKHHDIEAICPAIFCLYRFRAIIGCTHASCASIERRPIPLPLGYYALRSALAWEQKTRLS